MQFQHYNLGYKDDGTVIEVSLSGNAANVRLMDTINFQNYRNGRRHSFYGGHYTSSPVKLAVPSAGNWHLAIDLGGYRGRVNSSVRVL